jgi:hypothetical protein
MSQMISWDKLSITQYLKLRSLALSVNYRFLLVERKFHIKPSIYFKSFN